MCKSEGFSGKWVDWTSRYLAAILFLTAGEKFSDADLIGIPYRVVVSEKTIKAGKAEVKKRNEKNAKLMTTNSFIDLIE